MYIRALFAGCLGAVALIGVSLLALRGEFFPAPAYQVSPAALDEIRHIGIVRAEVSSEIDYDGNLELANTFVIEMGRMGAKESIDKAVKIFRKNGWEVLGKKGAMASMKSTKWNAHLVLYLYDKVNLVHYPTIPKNLYGNSPGMANLVIVSVDPLSS
jgi:hypothetical protein